MGIGEDFRMTCTAPEAFCVYQLVWRYVTVIMEEEEGYGFLGAEGG